MMSEIVELGHLLMRLRVLERLLAEQAGRATRGPLF